VQARWNWRIDLAALTLADRVVCDTWAHGALYERLGARRDRLRRVLVGAEDAFFAVGPPPAADPVRVCYVGGFLPLHGVPTMIEAVARLDREATHLPSFRVALVGKGMEFAAARALAERCAPGRIEFPGAVDYTDSPRVLADAHVVLGAFGASEKAGRVIPHKIYQGLAAGRAVVTGDGPGPREVFEPGVHLAMVPRANAAALASALAALIADPAARAALGARGRERALEIATVERVGESLRAAIEDGGGAHA
jgi:glycosyltransferase involved in cell wall biosynthesis